MNNKYPMKTNETTETDAFRKKVNAATDATEFSFTAKYFRFFFIKTICSALQI